ncbi:MAG: 2OG-Fe(II) oxygenase family protein [Pseudomonadota bacterium]
MNDSGIFNPDIDLTAHRKTFADKGYVRIENVLLPEQAERIETALASGVPWELCYLTESGPVSIPQSEYRAFGPAQAADLNQAILKQAKQGFAYFYYRSDLVRSENETLRAFYSELSGERCLGMFRYLTGEPGIRTVNGQVACFTAACFLKRHQDVTDKEKRIAAYVFSFTRNWDPDWGGHLHVLDSQLRNTDVFEPSFNSLTIFRVPRIHFVSQVCNYAMGARYTATGWMLA